MERCPFCKELIAPDDEMWGGYHSQCWKQQIEEEELQKVVEQAITIVKDAILTYRVARVSDKESSDGKRVSYGLQEVYYLLTSLR